MSRADLETQRPFSSLGASSMEMSLEVPMEARTALRSKVKLALSAALLGNSQSMSTPSAPASTMALQAPAKADRPEALAAKVGKPEELLAPPMEAMTFTPWPWAVEMMSPGTEPEIWPPPLGMRKAY